MELRGASADAQPQLADDNTQESRMDEYLRSLGFYRKKIAKDGSCLFRAVAEQVLHCQSLHTDVRMACVNYLRQNRSTYELFIEGDFEKYLENLQDPQSWVGQVEISALAELYKHDFIIFQQPDQPPVKITENGFIDTVRLCFLNGNHYDNVYPQSFEKSAAVCQSILYELLYDRVCGVDRSVLAPSVRGGRGRERLDSEECRSSEESDLEEGDFWSSEGREKLTSGVKSRQPQRGCGRGRFREGGRDILSAKVQKSLNPALYRNVEYDVWLRSKRIQQQQDFCMAAGMQYSAGDKCKVQLSASGRFYSACVKEVSPDNGPITVFIEELGRQHTVPLLNLRLPSGELQSWQKVSEKSKRHPAPNNEHTSSEWENRGGRRSVKSAPYSASGVCVHKQHSWPQTTTEEQTGGRSVTFRSDQRSSAVCVVPQEEENTLLVLLHKDEQNFPSLGTSPQTASVGEVMRRGGQKKSSRRKEHKGSVSETDFKAAPLKQQSNTEEKPHQRRVTEEPEPRSSLSIKEKSAVTPSSAPKTVPPPSQTDSAACPGLNKAAFKANKIIPVQTQNDSALSFDTSQLALAQSTLASIPTGQTTPVLTAVLPTAGHNSGSSQPTQTSSQNIPVISSAPTQVTPVIPPIPVQAPAFISTLAPSISAPNAPVKTTPLAQTAPSDSISAPLLIPASAVPVSATPFAPDQITAPILDTPDPSSFTSPTDGGSAATVQLTVDLHTTVTSTSPPHAHLTDDPTHAPPPATFQPSLNTSEPHPCESLATPVSDVAPAPNYLSAHQQSPYPHPQWSQLIQDPLYPGFPQNEKGGVETLPPFSQSRKGEDLPQDISVLRFFFNLGIKAYSQPLWPPITYLGPLNQAYKHLIASTSSLPSNLSVTPWQQENPSPLQNLNSIPDTALETQSHVPVAPVAVDSGLVRPIEMRVYNDHSLLNQMQVSPRPLVPWSASHSHGTYVGSYPVQFSSPPCVPPGNQLYPPSTVGFHSIPPPPVPGEAMNHGRMDVLSFAAPPLERSSEIGQTCMTLQFESSQKTACFPGGQPHLGGVDFKPVDFPVSLTTVEPPPFGGPCPVAQPFPLGPPPGDIAALNPLASGNLGRQGEVFSKSLYAGYCPDDDFTNVDLRVGQSFYSQSFYSQSYRGGGRRGQVDKRGNRGRGYRGRKDFSGRGRQDEQPYGSRGHYIKQGAGPSVGSQ